VCSGGRGESHPASAAQVAAGGERNATATASGYGRWQERRGTRCFAREWYPTPRAAAGSASFLLAEEAVLCSGMRSVCSHAWQRV